MPISIDNSKIFPSPSNPEQEQAKEAKAKVGVTQQTLELRIEIIEENSNVSKSNSVVSSNVPKVAAPPQETETHLLLKLSFFFFGVGSLIVWLTVWVVIDFFIFHFPTRNVTVILPFCNFALNIWMKFVIVLSKQVCSYKSQLIFGITTSICLLIWLPICTIFPGESLAFGLVVLWILINGFANSVMVCSFYGISSFFGINYIVLFSTGQAFAGIFLNVILYIILATIKEPDPRKRSNVIAWIFFSVSLIVLNICFAFVFLAYRDKYFIETLTKVGQIKAKPGEGTSVQNEKEKVEIESKAEVKSDNNSQTVITNVTNSNAIRIKLEGSWQNKPQQSSFKFYLQLFYKWIDINIWIVLNYAVSYTVYPGTSLKPRMFNLKGGFFVNTVIIIFNICDTLGRYIVNYWPRNKRIIYYISLLRIMWLITFPLNVFTDRSDRFGNLIGNSIFLIINVATLALTNGICTALSVTVAPTLVEKEFKDRAGTAWSMSIILGIFLGTLFAFAMSELTKWSKMQAM